MAFLHKWDGEYTLIIAKTMNKNISFYGGQSPHNTTPMFTFKMKMNENGISKRKQRQN